MGPGRLHLSTGTSQLPAVLAGGQGALNLQLILDVYWRLALLLRLWALTRPWAGVGLLSHLSKHPLIPRYSLLGV